MKVSVIVPVYNVEEYLDRSLNSLVNQTLKDIEVIVVNDGSPDNSQKIIDKYQKKYPKIIKSYIKENGGMSDARNFGIEKATGEYIAFLDSDDYIEPNTYEKLYKKAKEKDFDVVVCNLLYEWPNKIKKASSNITKDAYDEKALKKFMLDVYPSVWNKIYKRELYDKKIRFKKGVWFEDVEFTYRLYPFIKSIGVIDDHLIHYVQRSGSITKTFDERLFHYIDNWNGIIKFYKQKKLYDKYYKELEYCYVRYLYATFIKQATNYTDKLLYKEAVSCAIKQVKSNFPKYRRNKYFYKNFKGIYLLMFNKTIGNILYFIKGVK